MLRTALAALIQSLLVRDSVLPKTYAPAYMAFCSICQIVLYMGSFQMIWWRVPSSLAGRETFSGRSQSKSWRALPSSVILEKTRWIACCTLQVVHLNLAGFAPHRTDREMEL